MSTADVDDPDSVLERDVLQPETVCGNRSHDLGISGDRAQVDGRHATNAPRSTPAGKDCTTRKEIELALFVDEEPDSEQRVPRDVVHAELLRIGWRPIRWRHPELGDVEITSAGFWLYTDHFGGGVLMGPSDKATAALDAGRTFFKRDAEGNLLAVTAGVAGASTMADMKQRAREECLLDGGTGGRGGSGGAGDGTDGK